MLTSQNHTQTISARPDNRHLRYWMADSLPESADDWMPLAAETQGNWRSHWVAWLQGHSELKPAPAGLGSKAYPPLEAAPGRYVREK